MGKSRIQFFIPASFFLKVLLLVTLFGIGIASGYCQDASQPTILRLNLAGSQTTSADTLFDEVNYIPLQTTKESLIGAIYQLSVTRDYFILVDGDTNCILIFSKNGKFISKIFRSINERRKFWIDQDKKEIIFISGRNKVCYYSLLGLKLREKLQPIRDFTADAHFFPDGVIAYASYAVNEKFLPDSINHEIHLTSDNKAYREFLPYNMKNEPLKSQNVVHPNEGPFYSTENENTVYYSRPYDYTVYELSKSTLKEKFTFVFPMENTLSRSAFTENSFIADTRKYLRVNSQKISAISNIYQIGDCLYFNLNNWSRSVRSYALNLRSLNLFSTAYIRPDKSTLQLPLTDQEQDTGGFSYSDGRYLYASISAFQLLKQYKSASSKSLVYPALLTEFFKKGTAMDNPVVIQVRPRKNF